jgi:hypothetical protein
VSAYDFKKMYGDEYPNAMVENGVRMPLAYETPFSRYYQSGGPKKGGHTHIISRFMDGSASMTAAELRRGWPTWTDEEKQDFCQGCSWLYQQADYADMLRFIMAHGGLTEWSATALNVAKTLPRDEAFPFLLTALRASEIGKCANIAQAIAQTRHPKAEATLRQHLEAVWDHSMLWDDDEFVNWVALDAKCCIEHLITLGASPSDFEEQVRKLSQHFCQRNRDLCRRHLSEHYSWLK